MQELIFLLLFTVLRISLCVKNFQIRFSKEKKKNEDILQAIKRVVLTNF